MSALVRVGDPISCGDHVANGSNNVFINGLPVTHQGARTTTGHGCFPPTMLISNWASTVFVNSQPVALQSKTTIQSHRCGRHSHDGVVAAGSPDTYAES